MKLDLNKLGVPVAALVLIVGLAAAPAFGAGKAQTFNGQVSDAMCGAKHEMEGSPAAVHSGLCRATARNTLWSSGDKVYTLDGADKRPWNSWTNWLARKLR